MRSLDRDKRFISTQSSLIVFLQLCRRSYGELLPCSLLEDNHHAGLYGASPKNYFGISLSSIQLQIRGPLTLAMPTWGFPKSEIIPVGMISIFNRKKKQKRTRPSSVQRSNRVVSPVASVAAQISVRVSPGLPFCSRCPSQCCLTRQITSLVEEFTYFFEIHKIGSLYMCK